MRFFCKITFGRVLSFLLALAQLAGVAFAEPLYTNRAQFDSQYLREYQKLFEFNSVGELSSGPVSGQGVDYTPLLSDHILLSYFENLIFGCLEGIRYCPRPIFRWEELSFSLSLQLLGEEGVHPRDRLGWENLVNEFMEKFSNEIYFEDRNEGEQSGTVQIAFVVGSEDLLEDELRETQDDYGLGSLRVYREGLNVSFLSFFERKPPFCYVSTKDASLKGGVSIYTNEIFENDCLSTSLSIAIGLSDISWWFPSVTSHPQRTQKPSYADILFIKMLYHPKFPVHGGVVEVRNFWNQNVSQIRSEISFDGMGFK